MNDPEGEPEPEEDNSDEENQPAEDRNEEGNTVSNAECADDDEESGHEIKENNNGKDDHIEGKLSQAKHLLWTKFWFVGVFWVISLSNCLSDPNEIVEHGTENTGALRDPADDAVSDKNDVITETEDAADEPINR